MTDQEIRTMIRDSIARHLGNAPGAGDLQIDVPRVHASHALFPLASGGDGDGACLIEPSVRCTHCGYCLSYGH